MNVFQDVLRRIVERVEGARAVSLVGVDGIPIDSYGKMDGLSIESVAAELGAFVKSAQSPNGVSQAGTVQQLAVVTDRVITILSRVTKEYYAASRHHLQGHLRGPVARSRYAGRELARNRWQVTP